MSYKPNPNLNTIVKDAFEKSLKKSSDILERKSKSNAPVDSGALKNSIRSDDSDIKNGEFSVTSELEYAPFVEFGTSKTPANPFMRSALRESKKNMLSTFKDII
jgi:HK97 gp10 family phage protein